MTAFRSRWDDWTPKGPSPRTDKTDKSPSVSFVSSSPRPFSGEIDSSDPKTGVFPSIEGSQKAPTPRTDKTDRRAFVSSVSSSPRPISSNFDHIDPELDTSPPMEGSQETPSPLTDKTDKSLPRTLKPTTDEADTSLLRRAQLAVVPDLSDPEDIRVWLDERAAMREDSGTPRLDADKAAFDQLLWLWCAANPIEHTPGQCASCGAKFEPPVMSLPDGTQVCDQPEYACLIAYGTGRRMEAVGALHGLGIEQPMWWAI